jgi:hypothetical protein
MLRLVSPLRLAFALFAAALSSAAPIHAHARLAAAGHAGYAEICSDAGLKRLPLGAPDGGRGLPSGEHSHCGACLGSGGPAAPSAAPAALHPLAPCEPLARFTAKADTPIDVIQAARPRGPPLLDRPA